MVVPSLLLLLAILSLLTLVFLLATTTSSFEDGVAVAPTVAAADVDGAIFLVVAGVVGEDDRYDEQ